MRAILLLSLLALLCHCDHSDPNPNINIPDDNFLNALIELGVDTDGDGKVSLLEAEVITDLMVPGKNISDLTGIEKFVNLDSLPCRFNQLTSLDVSNNADLTTLKWKLGGLNLGTGLAVKF